MPCEQPTDVHRDIQTAILPTNVSRYFLSSDKQPALPHSSEPALTGSLYIHPASQSLNTQHAVSEYFTLDEHPWTDIQRQIRYDSCPRRTRGLIKRDRPQRMGREEKQTAERRTDGHVCNGQSEPHKSEPLLLQRNQPKVFNYPSELLLSFSLLSFGPVTYLSSQTLSPIAYVVLRGFPDS